MLLFCLIVSYKLSINQNVSSNLLIKMMRKKYQSDLSHDFTIDRLQVDHIIRKVKGYFEDEMEKHNYIQ